MSEVELRFFNGRAARPQADGNKLSGQAAPFMKPTLIGGAFREQIDPRAWNKTLADGDQVLLDNHDSSRPLARRSAGTLEAHAGHNGVQWRAQDVPDTSYAQDVIKNVQAGLYGGCSFSFTVTKNGERWDEDTPDGIPLRTLTDINVREISIVTFPAYSDTSVANRCVEMAFEQRSNFWRPTMEQYEEILRASNKPYGDVEYADPKNGKYPIDTRSHVRAAWDYINVAKNAAEYPLNGVTLSSVKAKIRSAAKKFGITISDDDGQNSETPQFTHEGRGFQLITTDEWDERDWQAFADEVSWARDNTSLGEPDASTRMPTPEERSHAALEAAELRKKIAAERRAVHNAI